MDFIGCIARRVTVLHEGVVLAEGTLSAVQADSRVVKVYLGVLASGISVLLGRNGVGKTIRPRAIMGVVLFRTGTIEFNGQPIQSPNERQIDERAGMVA